MAWRWTSRVRARIAIAAALAVVAPATPLHADIVPRGYPWPERHADDDADWKRPRLMFGVGVALAVLPEDLKRYWNPGPAWDATLLFPLTPYFDFLTRLEETRLGFDAGALRSDKHLSPAAVVRGDAASLSAGSIAGRIHLGTEGWRPYLELGVGLPDISVPPAFYDDPVQGKGSVGGHELFAFDPLYVVGAGVEWFRARTWGAYLEVRLDDAPGRTEPAHTWVSPRAGLSVRLPTFAR